MININSNYALVEETKIDEINSDAIVLKHNGTGAKVLILKNDDDNKVFSITFRTRPDDSTGVAHILEHSVLCGSKKYPVKEPFVEMSKGSLNTYLNAMTFPDKTMYPVASRNKKDFNNLMDVYLDAVFFPSIYEDDTVMMQEGWHYDCKDKDSDIKYKGVVYNEMKGVYSSPNSMVYRHIFRGLFKDTTYGVDSGGDPKEIPNLTQDQFLDFHKKYYHPSNSYIFLYGDVDIDERLEYIHNEYLSKFDSQEIDSKIQTQKPFSEKKFIQEYYPVADEESIDKKSYFTYNFVVSTCDDVTKNLAYEILEYVLLDCKGAVLKTPLIEQGLCDDVMGSFDKGILQPSFSIVCKNVRDSDKDKIKKIIDDTLQEIVDKGIDKKSLTAALNKKEFNLREAEFDRYPKGVVYSMEVMDSWLYDRSPLEYLKYNDNLAELRANIDTDYYENLIKCGLIENNFATIMMVSPKNGLEAKERVEVENKLKDIQSKLSYEEKENIIKDCIRLKEKQETPDSQENLRKIPTIELSDIETKIPELPLEVSDFHEKKYLYTNVFTNKIVYSTFLFDTSAVKEEDLGYIPLLMRMFTRVDTNKHSYKELAQDIDFYTGGIEAGASVLVSSKDRDKYMPYASIKGKAIDKNTGKLLDIMREIIEESNLDDKARMKEIVMELRSRIESVLGERGHVISATRALSYEDKILRYSEKLSGYEYYEFLVKLSNDLDNNFEEVREKLKEVQSNIFDKKNMYVLLTCGEEEKAEFDKHLEAVYKSLGDKKLEKQVYKLPVLSRNEAFTTSGTVQFVAKAGNISKYIKEYDGSSQVLKTVLSLDYLWNNVRVKGGAYGGFASIQRSGSVFLTSYRDPNLGKTLKIYDNAYKFIKNFNPSDEELKKYIIGTISEIDYPLTPVMIGERAKANYFKELTAEDIAKERNEIINTKKEDITKYADAFKKLMEEDNICVIGNEKKINENKKMFDKIEKLIK